MTRAGVFPLERDNLVQFIILFARAADFILREVFGLNSFSFVIRRADGNRPLNKNSLFKFLLTVAGEGAARLRLSDPCRQSARAAHGEFPGGFFIASGAIFLDHVAGFKRLDLVERKRVQRGCAATLAFEQSSRIARLCTWRRKINPPKSRGIAQRLNAEIRFALRRAFQDVYHPEFAASVVFKIGQMDFMRDSDRPVQADVGAVAIDRHGLTAALKGFAVFRQALDAQRNHEHQAVGPALAWILFENHRSALTDGSHCVPLESSNRQDSAIS